MNMWGGTPSFFSILEEGFETFLNEIAWNDVKTEYLLPVIISKLLKDNKIVVKVLRTSEKWTGVTYKEDKEVVVRMIQKLIDSGAYEKLDN